MCEQNAEPGSPNTPVRWGTCWASSASGACFSERSTPSLWCDPRIIDLRSPLKHVGPGIGVRASPCLWTFDLKRCVATQDFEVVVAGEQGRRSSNGNGSDEAVDEPSHCFSMPATRAVQSGCVFVVGRFGGQQGGAPKEPSKVAEVLLVSCAGEHFHSDGVAGGDLVVQEGVDSVADRAACVTQELDPRRGVDDDHGVRAVRNSSRSPSQPDPRSRRAFSRLNGSPARVRKAKFTASRLVARRYRCMTTSQASSSMSMLVRLIHL